MSTTTSTAGDDTQRGHLTVPRATRMAGAAAPALAASAPAEWAAWLRAVADALDARVDDLAAVAVEETALGLPRLTGEVGRTTGQLRLFAGVLVRGEVTAHVGDPHVVADPPVSIDVVIDGDAVLGDHERDLGMLTVQPEQQLLQTGGIDGPTHLRRGTGLLDELDVVACDPGGCGPTCRARRTSRAARRRPSVGRPRGSSS